MIGLLIDLSCSYENGIGHYLKDYTITLGHPCAKGNELPFIPRWISPIMTVNNARIRLHSGDFHSAVQTFQSGVILQGNAAR